MNYREIIGPDELDWKVIPLDWKKIGKEELKLGTPMSKDGVVANDASCYGILMDDVQKDKHFQARVIVSGCVDFAKAEEYSGIKISAEAKKAIGKVWSQGGGGLTELPEGYPYKEGVTIEWDGNTEGKLAIDGNQHYKVSDLVLSDEEIKNGVLTAFGEQTEYTISDMWDNLSAGGLINEDYVAIGIFAVFVRTAGASVSFGGASYVFPETGVYFANMGEGMITTKFVSETIHPMAEEFLPEPQTVTFTMNAEGGGYTASHTGAEIAEMAKRGTVVGKFEDNGIRLLLRYIGGMNGNACFVSGFANDNGGNIYVFDVAANSTSVNMGAIGN